MQLIDRIDKAIIDLLAKDGRLSANEIARQIGDITPRIARYRLERLLANKTIHIAAVSIPQEVGLNIIADIKVKVEAGKVLAVARQLAAYEQMTYVGCSIGDGDIGAQVVASSLEEAYNFITEVIGNIPGVRGTSTMIVPIVLKDAYMWIIPQNLVSNEETTEPE
ncbi:MAG: Lrp/AsnC family transcriptional regulator [Chloroflexi bacterium]|nr:Lrp/AsnC family transcriptional regulator [Chloroflexota bacterium]